MRTMPRFRLDAGAILVIARSDGVRDAISSTVDAVCERAQVIGGQVRRSGHYAEAFAPEMERTAKGWVGTVRNSDFKANWIEFGTGDPLPTQKYRVFGRALDAVRGP